MRGWKSAAIEGPKTLAIVLLPPCAIRALDMHKCARRARETESMATRSIGSFALGQLGKTAGARLGSAGFVLCANASSCETYT